ncbi:MAG TPA: class 1 fructose-bisphosphatase [Patescibacteria group bacterium]
MSSLTNLTRHLLELEEFSPKSHQLADVINQLVLASKLLSRDINRAGLTSILGSAGSINSSHQEQKKLDVIANDIFLDLMKQSPYVCAVGTEEAEELIVFDDAHHQQAEYIVYMDPVDGSSNIDVNVSIGTNFVIFKRRSAPTQSLTPEDYLQPGKQAVAAGYIVYGSSTILVYSTGKGVNGFTLDQSLGEYILSHPHIKYPDTASIYSVNESYSPLWPEPFKKLIESYKANGQNFTARYIGSLVADFHRNLLKGGIYLYPADTKNPQGKLRLLYEGIPFAYLAEQAGGAATDGKQAILEIIPTEIHQKTPLFVGNKNLVSQIA